jgi:epoxyqueuosine reductase
MLITPGLGSFTLLGELVTDLDLPSDPPMDTRCGRCTACIDACPTGAIQDGRIVDSRRCISYLTIELDGPIPLELRPLVGDWIFGCDLCQEVCPFNAAAPDLVPADLRPRPGRSRPFLRQVLAFNRGQFRRFIAQSAMRRVRRRQLLRNVCVALGNVGTKDDVPALVRALSDRAPLVRGHAAWALGRLGARASLLAASSREENAYVLSEVDAALGSH